MMADVQEVTGGYSHILSMPLKKDLMKTEDPVLIDVLN